MRSTFTPPTKWSNKPKNNWQNAQNTQRPSAITAPTTSTEASNKENLINEVSNKTKDILSSKYFWAAITLTAAGAGMYYFSKQPTGQRIINNASDKTRATYNASIAMLTQWVNYSKYYTGHLKASPSTALNDAKNTRNEIANQIKTLDAIKSSNKTFIEAIEAAQKTLKIAVENISKKISDFEAKLSANTQLSDDDIQVFKKAINDEVLSTQVDNNGSDPLIEVLEEPISPNNSSFVGNDKLNHSISDDFPRNKSNNDDEESTLTPNNSLTSPVSQTANTQPLVQKANVQQFIADDITMISFANAQALTEQQNKLSMQNNNATMKHSTSTDSSSDDESVNSVGAVNIKDKTLDKAPDQNSNPSLHTQEEQNNGYLKRALGSFGSAVGGLLWRSSSQTTQVANKAPVQEDTSTLLPTSPVH